MANAMLAYANYLDRSLLQDGFWLDSLPLENLHDRTIGLKARTPNLDLTSTMLTIDLQGRRFVRTIAMVSHNLTVAAKYRITSSNTSDFAALIVDTGWLDVWQTAYPYGTVPWGSPSWWSGKYSAEDLEGATRTTVHTFPVQELSQFWRIEFDDQDNDDGFFELGRVFIGDAWQFACNMNVGASLGLETDTTYQKAISGAKFFDARPATGFTMFELRNMKEAEAMSRALEVMRRSGTSGEVVFQWDPDDDMYRFRRTLYGHLAELSPLTYPRLERWATAYKVAELI